MYIVQFLYWQMKTFFLVFYLLSVLLLASDVESESALLASPESALLRHCALVITVKHQELSQYKTVTKEAKAILMIAVLQLLQQLHCVTNDVKYEV